MIIFARSGRGRFAATLLAAILSLAVACAPGAAVKPPAPADAPAATPAGGDQQQLMEALRESAPDDEEVVALVDGEPVTRGTVRKGALPIQAQQPGTSDGEARKIAFHRAAKNAVAVAEAKRRGLQMTPEEAQRAADYLRELWGKAPPEQRALLEGDLKDSGLTEEEYWQRFKDGYARSMLPMKLAQQRAEEAAKAKPLVQPAPFDDYLEELLSKARIEYEDPSLQP